jgi:hypothetical protein
MRATSTIYILFARKRRNEVAIEFYDVKLRKKVSIEEGNVRKTTFKTKNGQVRHGLRAKTDDGRNLTKFISKTEWDSLKIPEE